MNEFYQNCLLHAHHSSSDEAQICSAALANIWQGSYSLVMTKALAQCKKESVSAKKVSKQ